MRTLLLATLFPLLSLVAGCTSEPGQPLGEVAVQIRARYLAPTTEWHRLASGEEARITDGTFTVSELELLGDAPPGAPSDPHQHLTAEEGEDGVLLLSFGSHNGRVDGRYEGLTCGSEHCHAAGPRITAAHISLQELTLRGQARPAGGGPERPFEITLNGGALIEVPLDVPIDVHHRPVVTLRISLDLPPTLLDHSHELRVLPRAAFLPIAAPLVDVQIERRTE